MAIVDIRKKSNEPQWTSDRRIYLDKNGKVVEANDPAKLTLLVATGGSIPMAEAIRYGLVKTSEPPAAAAESTSDEPKDEEAGDEGGNSGDASESLESMKVAELRELAEAEGVDLTGVTLKADIIKAIEEKRAAE